jgi:Tfp pilus assembly protein PilN
LPYQRRTEVARRINLVPSSERARTSTNYGMLGLAAAVLIVIFGLGLGYYMLGNTRSDREEELTTAERETQSVKTQVDALREYGRLASDRAEMEELVRQIYVGRTLVGDILDDIGMVVPEKVWFEGLGITTPDPTAIGAPAADLEEPEQGSLTLDGMTYEFEDVAQLLVRLQLIDAISDISLGNAASEGEDSTIKKFSVEAVVSNTQDLEARLPMSEVEVEGQ